jgi:hypothetical protein
VVTGTTSQTIWIVDDDQVYISFSPANSSVSEASGRAPVAVVITTDRGTPTTRPVTVSYATVAGSATAGLDFGAASGTFTVAAGTASGTTIGADFSVVNDAMTEPTETFSVTLSAPGAIASGPHTVSIVNDDSSGYRVQVDLVPSTQTVSEAAGAVTLTARVTTADGRPTPSAVGLTLRTVHEWGGANPASPNVDYQAFGQAGSGPVWFSLPAGMASGATASVSVLLANDGWAEADEWFQFRIAPAAASVVPVQLVWIADDDRVGARSYSSASTLTASGSDATGTGTTGTTGAGAGAGTGAGAATGAGGAGAGTGATGSGTSGKGAAGVAPGGTTSAGAGAGTFPRGATTRWQITGKTPPPPPTPVTWTTKGGAR